MCSLRLLQTNSGTGTCAGTTSCLSSSCSALLEFPRYHMYVWVLNSGCSLCLEPSFLILCTQLNPSPLQVFSELPPSQPFNLLYLVLKYSYASLVPLSLCVCVSVLSHVRLFATPWTVVHHVPPWDFQASILKRVAISSFRAFSLPRDGTRVSCVSCTGQWVLHHWAPGKPLSLVFV